MKIGMVIGSYNAVPHINLSLELAKRYYPKVKILISDDNSPKKEELISLSKKYNCDYRSNKTQLGHHPGDLSHFKKGLKWAKENKLDFIFKLSRTFVPLNGIWISDFKKLYNESECITYSSVCDHYKFGFRTECVIMKVKEWNDPVVFNKIKTCFKESGGHVFVESFIHQLSQDLSRKYHGKKYLNYINENGIRDVGFLRLNWINNNRHKACNNYLWHNGNSPMDYYLVAKKFGLNYSIDDFSGLNSHRNI